MEEPSVLDYLKSLLNPWKKEKILIPENDQPGESAINRGNLHPKSLYLTRRRKKYQIKTKQIIWDLRTKIDK
jgi:hypothetical protein